MTIILLTTKHMETKEERRAHKRRQRGRNKAKFVVRLQDMVDRAREEHDAFNRFPTNKLQEGNKTLFDWRSMPGTLDPKVFNLPGIRGDRKRLQCESFARALYPIITELHKKLNRKVRIVDFGSGTGNASLPLAYWFRNVAVFTLVERYPVPSSVSKKRAADAGLENVECIAQYIHEWKNAKIHFDIGFSSHACGSATDDALMACLDIGASFVLVSCCVGKLKFVDENVLLPRSNWMRSIFSREEFLEISRAGDHSLKDYSEESSEWKRDCKLLLEIDRLELAKESLMEYELHLSKLDPLDCSPKNDIICGYRK